VTHESTPHRRFSDIVHAVLIMFLLILLLVVGSLSIGYMVESAQNNTKYELLRNENQQLMNVLEVNILEGVDRELSALERRIFTAEKRIQALESKVQDMEQQEERTYHP